MTKRALTMLNENGDVTIVWDEEQDDAMEAIIAKKMALGVSFFIIEARLMGLVKPKKVLLKDATEARKHRALAIPDEDFSRFVESGGGDAVPTPEKPVKTVKRSKDPAEVAKSESVGVARRQGG